MNAKFPSDTDAWIFEQGPQSDIVVSSRARLARNLPGFPFAPRAKKEQLAEVTRAVNAAIEADPFFKEYAHFEIKALTTNERRYLREGHRISTELEKGSDHREVYVSAAPSASIMINEEDHLRIHVLRAGLRLNEVYNQVNEVELALERNLHFAYNPQFGYLTACPTNTGTGLRVSVMLHLVGLVMTGQIEEAMAPLGNFGLVVRGAQGEHSGHVGDLFQVSNEVTLGKTEEELIQMLAQVVEQIILREMRAREFLYRQEAIKCEDAVLRALGILGSARAINSEEAISLLSRLRLGIDHNLGIKMTHEELNGLLIEVQPAHLLRIVPQSASSGERDVARAAYLRAKFSNGGSARNN
ncbi:protein arginine kinase [Candidatus Sumerlaeota bacterium]|nr:protein arginine kinase [Candidatus Sumerlaeota bacterium]